MPSFNFPFSVVRRPSGCDVFLQTPFQIINNLTIRCFNALYNGLRKAQVQ